MNRFYNVATEVLMKTDAFIDKFVGDEVIGLYFPLFTGPNHARAAVQAAQDLLRVTGHGEKKGPWLPVTVGVHTGIAYVGTVRGAEDSVSDITALGDNVNITARLASSAGSGEALISDAAYTAAGLDLGNLEQRQLELKGKSELIGVHVLKA
jgi:adenylate cyclase